jgi:hypothetical protein
MIGLLCFALAVQNGGNAAATLGGSLASLARDMKRAPDDVPDDWSPLRSVNHVDRILDERPLRATSSPWHTQVFSEQG